VTLPTPTLYLVRHGLAVSKSRWRGDDAHRPLEARGMDQARALAEWLPGPVSAVLSSPTLRCVGSMLALAERHRVDICTRWELAVGHPEQAAALLRDLLHRSGVVVCTHGEVLPGLLGSLPIDEHDHPLERTAKGAVWTIVGGAAGAPLRATYHEFGTGPRRATSKQP
jgi:8-oxo-dGTP diphosphatase